MPQHLACHPQKAERLPTNPGCASGNVTTMGLVVYWERHLSRDLVRNKLGDTGTHRLEGPGPEDGLRGDDRTVLAVSKYLRRATGEPWFCIKEE